MSWIKKRPLNDFMGNILSFSNRNFTSRNFNKWTRLGVIVDYTLSD